MYPSIDNKIGLQACRKILDSREVLKPSTDCLLDAIKITLDNNNSTFNNTHYLQTDGTAMGPKNACSYADVSVSKIDELVFQHEYLKPRCWGRYRDDCLAFGMAHWKSCVFLHPTCRQSTQASDLQSVLTATNLSSWTFWLLNKMAD